MKQVHIIIGQSYFGLLFVIENAFWHQMIMLTYCDAFNNQIQTDPKA